MYKATSKKAPYCFIYFVNLPSIVTEFLSDQYKIIP